MAWYEEAVFYHIYPLGLTGAPKQNPYGEPVHRLNKLLPWITHIKKMGCTALYIGPLFESVGHGYETTDYKKLDSRLGTNEDLTAFVAECHRQGLHVIFDGVFNHTGRDFFAFRDLKEKREGSPYRDWYCNVNFGGNNEYNDGFSYENWGGYNLLVKLNQRNPAVRDYICDVIRFWVQEFDVDGIRLDAADVLDFEFMKAIRGTANALKPDFWLMGEVIHGDYSRWANQDTLHSVTNYMLHKALYSAHNEHNYFELAHTIRYVDGMAGGGEYSRSLYSFVDNHDVERISTKLTNKANYVPAHILLYTLPGIPSVYYGSEFGLDGQKQRGGSDDAIRPSIHLADFVKTGIADEDDGIPTTAQTAPGLNPEGCLSLLTCLGRIKHENPSLSYGDYEQRCLTNCQFAYTRRWQGQEALVAVNNADQPAQLSIPASFGYYTDAMTGEKKQTEGGTLNISIPACSGRIWISTEPGEEKKAETAVDAAVQTAPVSVQDMGTAQGRKAAPAADPYAAPADGCDTKADGTDKKDAPSETENRSTIIPETDNRKANITETVYEKPVSATNAAAYMTSLQTEAEEENKVPLPNIPYEEMTVAQLQQAILGKLAANGPVTDSMKKDVRENIWKDSLLNWVKSFR